MSTSTQAHLTDICLQVDGLLDAYALDALEPSERELVERHLETCPEQRERLAELDDVISIISRSVPSVAPPPALWQRLSAEIASSERGVPSADRAYRAWGPAAVPTPPVSAPAPATPPAPVALPRRSNVVVMNRWVARLAAVAAVLLLATTAALGVLLQRENDDGDGNELPDTTLVELVAGGGRVVPLSTQSRRPEAINQVGQGSILVAPGKTPAVVVDHWTPSNEQLQYLVWMAAADDEQPTVLGEIIIDEDGHGVLILDGVTSFEGYDIFGISIKTTEEAGLENVLLGTPPEQTG